MPEPEVVFTEVAGRTLRLTNLSKVLYPLVGFTKAQVIEYYARIAPVMLDHVGDRGVTFKRWPDGVTADPFFNKRCPDHRPEWVDTCLGPGDRKGGIHYCRLDEVASIVWAANLAALEIHAPMARGDDIESPTMVVFDLDPGAPATIVECAQIAILIRDVLELLGLEAYPKTSGSKGMQLYLPLNQPHSHEHASQFALAVAQLIEKQHPTRVTSTMAKKERPGKIFIDWSQNSRHKTTIAPYSLRGKERPTVSTPLTWDEVDDGASGEPLYFESSDVLERVDAVGDLFGPTVTLEQTLPAPAS